jgi:hypothetical protein
MFCEGQRTWQERLKMLGDSCRTFAATAQDVCRTTHGRLLGAGADGMGDDVSPFREDGTTLHETRLALPLEGEWTLAGFCDHLATLELFPQPPEWAGAVRFRNWAFESAALDLALRQAGRSLHDILRLEPQAVRFVNSLGLGKEPSIEPLQRRMDRSPGVRIEDAAPVGCRQPSSCHHPVLEVRDAGRLDCPELLKLDLGVPEVVEEASALAEQYRYEVELKLVQ